MHGLLRFLREVNMSNQNNFALHSFRLYGESECGWTTREATIPSVVVYCGGVVSSLSDEREMETPRVVIITLSRLVNRIGLQY
jgi:hypothetical protein